MPIPMEPIFDFSNTSIPTVLKDGSSEISTSNASFKSTKARVMLNFSPRPHIRVETDINRTKEFFTHISDPMSISKLRVDGAPIDGFCTNLIQKTNSAVISIKWAPKIVPFYIQGNESSEIKYLLAHLFNFTGFIKNNGLPERCGNTLQLINKLIFKDDEWTITIQSLSKTSERIKQSRSDGSAQLTHLASIKKNDNTNFSGKDAECILKLLYGFLSFTKGNSSHLVCPTGFDSANNQLWQKLSTPSSPTEYISSWFPSHSPEHVEKLFPLYSKLWARAQWGETLHEVIYWYLNANNSTRGIDAGIILTQTALERLSFEFSVQEKKLLLTKGFKDLWASDKFRMLFSSLNIPLEIPEACPKLNALAKQHNLLDAPHALTEIRNSLIHPDHKKRGQFKDAMHEVWNLGLWYLEMSILAICDYPGVYSNRLTNGWEGETENVPWAQSPAEEN